MAPTPVKEVFQASPGTRLEKEVQPLPKQALLSKPCQARPLPLELVGRVAWGEEKCAWNVTELVCEVGFTTLSIKKLQFQCFGMFLFSSSSSSSSSIAVNPLDNKKHAIPVFWIVPVFFCCLLLCPPLRWPASSVKGSSCAHVLCKLNS